MKDLIGYLIGSLVLAAAIFVAVIAFATSPEIPEETVPGAEYLPVNTEARAIGFTNALFEFPCEGTSPDGYELGFKSTLMFDKEPDEYGFYGSPGTTLINGMPKIIQYTELVECYTIEEYYPDGGEKSGHVVFQLMFDPNNGWVQQQVCDYNRFPDDCPKDENGDYVYIARQSPFDNPDSEVYQALS